MASVVKIKRSAVGGKAPTTSDITAGELALNTADGRLYSSKGVSTFEVGANTHSLYVGTGGATFGNGAFSLPTTDGSADQVIKTNGSGVLTWTDQSGGAAVQTMPFYNSSGTLDTITITGSSFTFYDSTGTADSIDISTDINLNSLADVSVAAPSLNQVLRYNGTSWVSSDSAGASWSALTSTNTAIRTLVGQNLANTNAYIASVSTAERSALANTNAYIASVSTAERSALANTNSYIATKAPSSNPSFTGSFQVTGPTSGNGEIYLTDGDTTGLGNSLLIKKAGSEAYINNRSAGALNFWTNNGSRVVIDSIGRTKIGDGIGPNYLLDVVTSDGDSVVQVKTAGTDATDDTIIRNVIGGTTAKNYINFGDSADDDIGSIIYDHGTDALSFNVNATEAMSIASNGDITTAGSITPGTYKPGEIIETIACMCDGSTVTVQSGSYTITNVTAAQASTTSYAVMNGSSISYTPPAGTKRVLYRYNFKFDSTGYSSISHFKFQIDGTDVVPASRQYSSNYASTNWHHANLELGIEWVIDCDAASNDAANGKFTSWTSPKTLRGVFREYGGGYSATLHNNVWWDGTSASGGYAAPIKPFLYIQAIA